MFELKKRKPLIIAGPCSAETREQTLETARRLAATGRVDMIRAGIWKPRTRPGTFEGVGVRGLAWLDEARKETGLPVAVEVASSKHVENALEFGIDVLWIGARTTVNPFSVQDIADALRGVDIPVFVKNPMNPDVELWQGAVQRLQAVGIGNMGLIHRGFSTFGASSYRNNPMYLAHTHRDAQTHAGASYDMRPVAHNRQSAHTWPRCRREPQTWASTVL